MSIYSLRGRFNLLLSIPLFTHLKLAYWAWIRQHVDELDVKFVVAITLPMEDPFLPRLSFPSFFSSLVIIIIVVVHHRDDDTLVI